jgi:hypothetical protein
LVAAGSGSGQSARKAQHGKAEAPHAVVAGTVFRDPGFAQPGATVSLARKDQPGKKLDQVESNYRGEFSFHVPPGPATYVVTATLKGFKPERQEFEISGEEQVNATLLLIPESNK